MTGYEKLTAAVMKDCNDRGHCGCFNPDGCNVEHQTIGEYGHGGYKHCLHAYCDQFKWIIDRAKHYAEKTGIPWQEILDSWEAHRHYWYMNYYQECNQPKIGDDRVYVFETLEDLKESIGNKGFRCPKCGRISESAYECTNDGCDWNAYGLFGTLGKGAYVFVKEEVFGQRIFMPVAWEEDAHENDD